MLKDKILIARMSIEKFTTEGLIISNYASGESDVVFKIYTRDFGVITAKQSSLKKSVKLRPHLMQNRFTNVTIVKGKELYRIAGARESDLNKTIFDSNNNQESIVPYICHLINRFLSFEIKNVKLYERLVAYVKALNLDVDILKLCVLADIMIFSGYLDTGSIGMTLKEYKSSSIDDVYIKVVIDKVNIVKNLRSATEGSML